MEELWILILVAFFTTNSPDKAESVKAKLEETPLSTFNEIFGEGWWDKDEAFNNSYSNQIDESVAKKLGLSYTTIYNWKSELGQPIAMVFRRCWQPMELTIDFWRPTGWLHAIRSMGIPLRKCFSDEVCTIFDLLKSLPPPLIKRNEEMEDKAESVKVKLEETPLKTFDEIFGEGWWDKNEAEHLKMPPTIFGQNVNHQIDRQNTQLGQIGPNSTDQNPSLTEADQYGQIEPNSTDQLEQIEPNSTDQNPALIEADHSDNAKNGEEQRQLALSFKTIYNWKRELGQTTPNHLYSDSEQKEFIKRYYEIKAKTPKIRDADIAKRLNISRFTLYKWKKQFKRQQFHPNSVDRHSVEENAAANVQEIENSNSGNI
uniref:Helix-turn-helix domain-containing protein n=2 Tax=Globodera rostochiensis TaxID=31243 RepID=A0A914HSY3_GLORO